MELKKLLNIPSDYEILYLTKFGSKLYGTSSETSDEDIKGIFIPSMKDIILKQDNSHFNYNSNKTSVKNTKKDVDIELWSIYKFFSLLKKGETGAIDLLYSMFREDTILDQNTVFTDKMKANHELFLSKNFKAFVGYCISQAHRYGLRGSRYGDVLQLIEMVNEYLDKVGKKMFYESPLSLFLIEYKNRINDLKHCKIIKDNDKTFLSVLGKFQHNTIKMSEFYSRLIEIKDNYGKRTKESVNGFDFKATSHAIRVLKEMEELINERKIIFPLKDANEIKKIKYGHKSKEQIIEMIEKGLDTVQTKLNQSDLPEVPNYQKINEFQYNLLKLLLN